MMLTAKGWVAIALVIGACLSFAEGRPGLAVLLALFFAALWGVP